MAFLRGRNRIVFETAEGGIYNLSGKSRTENRQLWEWSSREFAFPFLLRREGQGSSLRDLSGLPSAMAGTGLVSLLLGWRVESGAPSLLQRSEMLTCRDSLPLSLKALWLAFCSEEGELLQYRLSMVMERHPVSLRSEHCEARCGYEESRNSCGRRWLVNTAGGRKTISRERE